MIWELWWIWVSAGIMLGILEVLVPGFIFLGFALGAVIVGMILLIGGGLAAWLAGSLSVLMLVFACLSLIAWLVLRKVMGVRHNQSRIVTRDINDQ